MLGNFKEAKEGKNNTRGLNCVHSFFSFKLMNLATP